MKVNSLRNVLCTSFIAILYFPKLITEDWVDTVQTQEYRCWRPCLLPLPKNQNKINAQIIVFQVISQIHSHKTRLSKTNLLGTIVDYSPDSQGKCNGLSKLITEQFVYLLNSNFSSIPKSLNLSQFIQSTRHCSWIKIWSKDHYYFLRQKLRCKNSPNYLSQPKQHKQIFHRLV